MKQKILVLIIALVIQLPVWATTGTGGEDKKTGDKKSKEKAVVAKATNTKAFTYTPWLIEKMFSDLGNDWFQNENNSDRFMIQLFALWKATTWSQIDHAGYQYITTWVSTAGATPPGISPHAVAYDKSLFFYDYEYSTHFATDNLIIDRSSSTDGNTKFEYHPFQPVILTGKVGDDDELSLTEPIPAIFYAGLIESNNLQNNVTRLSLAADVILTVSAVGNLTKLRHLTKLNQIARIAIAGLDLSTSAIDLILNYTELCQDPVFCGQLKKYNFYLQMALLAEVGNSLLFKNDFKRVYNEAKDGYTSQRPAVVTKYGENSDEIKKLDEHFGLVEAGGTTIFGRSFINSLKGFSDDIASLASKQGLTIDEFKLLQQKRFDLSEMSATEIGDITTIRDAIPLPNGNTVLQKVIPKSDIQKYLRDTDPYYQIGGFVTTAKDSKHLSTFEDVYYGMRLDYVLEGGIKPFKLSDGSFGVIRYKTPSPNATVPKLPNELGDFPYTGNGFTGGNNGRLGVPEWKTPYNTPTDGAELWEVASDGSETLKAIFNSNQNKFIAVP